ncbi:Smr protein/MutS2 [invertebrate metagenome]|uniref:Smr protein/MutS2 n=1 Tax=invertebrate metagenome TaxID=1711999 RepID=A0A484H786_9ZZZZ
MTTQLEDEKLCWLFSADDNLVWTQVIQAVVPIDRALWEESSWGVEQPEIRHSGTMPHGRAGQYSWLGHGDDTHIDRRTATRFRRGRLSIESRLDLHGLGQPRAHVALRRFVDMAWRSGLRSVLVITGKGNRADGSIGVLRAAVPLWLNEPDLRPKVLSFTYARPRDGGEGALYLLIRRRRVAA